MKKIKFNYRYIIGGYDKKLCLQTELRTIEGYLFIYRKYLMAVHKFFWPTGHCGGWRVTELSTGCGITQLLPTRKAALAQFEEMQTKKFARQNFDTLLKQRVNNTIKDYGLANDIKKLETNKCGK